MQWSVCHAVAVFGVASRATPTNTGSALQEADRGTMIGIDATLAVSGSVILVAYNSAPRRSAGLRSNLFRRKLRSYVVHV
jgi:hypothetical protein